MKIVKWLGIGDKFYACSQQLWVTQEGLHRCKERGNTRKRNEKQDTKKKKTKKNKQESKWKSNAKVSSVASSAARELFFNISTADTPFFAFGISMISISDVELRDRLSFVAYSKGIIIHASMMRIMLRKCRNLHSEVLYS